MKQRIGILTGGGDCPGLNAVIRAVVRKSIVEGYEVVGFKNGWKGVIEKDTLRLDREATSGILPKGGTILGTSRTNPYKVNGGVDKVKKNFNDLGLTALIAMGGEDTLGAANKLSAEGLNIIGVPKTIDNDLSATDYTFGFDTAVNIATEAIDRLHSTAESHHRIIVVEIMGRHAGWITLHAGLAGGADVIMVPEFAVDLDWVCDILKKRREQGRLFSIVAVAEGAKLKGQEEMFKTKKRDAFGHALLGGIGSLLTSKIEEKTGYETRSVVLGHLQRGGTPTAFDRVLATRFGVKAVELVKKKKFGQMVSLSGNKIVDVPLAKAVGKLKTVDKEFYELAKIFCG